MWKLLLIDDSGSLMNGTRLVSTSSTKISRNGAHAMTASLRVSGSDAPLPSVAEDFALYSSGTSPLRIRAKRMMQTMLQIAPMISGSSGPTKVANTNIGTIKETAATMIIPIMPLNALNPFPTINIRRNGKKQNMSTSIFAVSADSLTMSNPVILEKW